MLSNPLLSIQLVQIGADKNQIKGDMHIINLDHSRKDTGHCRGFSGPGIYIWKMEKDLFTTIGSGQLPQCHGNPFGDPSSDSDSDKGAPHLATQVSHGVAAMLSTGLSTSIQYCISQQPHFPKKTLAYLK